MKNKLILSVALLAGIMISRQAISQDQVEVTYPAFASTDGNGSDNTPSATPVKRTMTAKIIINMAAEHSKTEAHALVHQYFLGIDDADSAYAAKRTGKKFVFAATLIGTPVLGVIPALICSAAPVKDKNLPLKDPSLLNNHAYMQGYRHEALTIKKRAIWCNFIAASGIWLGIIPFLL